MSSDLIAYYNGENIMVSQKFVLLEYSLIPDVTHNPRSPATPFLLPQHTRQICVVVLLLQEVMRLEEKLGRPDRYDYGPIVAWVLLLGSVVMIGFLVHFNVYGVDAETDAETDAEERGEAANGQVPRRPPKRLTSFGTQSSERRSTVLKKAKAANEQAQRETSSGAQSVERSARVVPGDAEAGGGEGGDLAGGGAAADEQAATRLAENEAPAEKEDALVASKPEGLASDSDMSLSRKWGQLEPLKTSSQAEEHESGQAHVQAAAATAKSNHVEDTANGSGGGGRKQPSLKGVGVATQAAAAWYSTE